MNTAKSIIVKVFNKRRNSDLRADNPDILAALLEFEARDARIGELEERWNKIRPSVKAILGGMGPKADDTQYDKGYSAGLIACLTVIDTATEEAETTHKCVGTALKEPKP